MIKGAGRNARLFADGVGGSAFITELGEDGISCIEKLVDPDLATGLAACASQIRAVNSLVATPTRRQSAVAARWLTRPSALTRRSGSPPLGLHQPGDAVLKKGTWYVTALTACAFAALNPDDANKPAVAECYQALGHDVPVPTS